MRRVLEASLLYLTFLGSSNDKNRDTNITSEKRIELSTGDLQSSPLPSSDTFSIMVLLSKEIRGRVILPLSSKD